MHSVEEPPVFAAELVADVLYLRPAYRPALLGVLAELGIFVRELSLLPFREEFGRGHLQGELLLVLADGEVETLQVVADLASTGASVIALVETTDLAPALRQAGATIVVDESFGVPALRRALRDAARECRSRRTGVSPGAVRVFGNLEFRTSPPELAQGRRASTLSPVEFGIMHTLARSHGELVPRHSLHASLRRNGEEVSDGYLKTVILRIRRKAETLGGDATLLEAVRGSGYVLRR